MHKKMYSSTLLSSSCSTVDLSRPLSSLDLLHLIHKNESLAQSFKCIYAANSLPHLGFLTPTKFIVVNTDILESLGLQWFALFMNIDTTISYFCSLGHRPVGVVRSYLTAHGTYHVAMYRRQRLTSHLCGLYCIFYAYMRCVGYDDFNICNDMLTDRICRNEVLLHIFYNKLVSKHLESFA